MKYPNLRYGNPLELQHYAQGIKIKELAKRLRRSERSVKDWLEGKKKIPWWIPEVLRLQHMEHCNMMRQMGMKPIMKKFGIVSGKILEFKRPLNPNLKNDQQDTETPELTMQESFLEEIKYIVKK